MILDHVCVLLRAQLLRLSRWMLEELFFFDVAFIEKLVFWPLGVDIKCAEGVGILCGDEFFGLFWSSDLF